MDRGAFLLPGSVNEPVVRTESCEASPSGASVNAERREGGKSYPRSQNNEGPLLRGLFASAGQSSIGSHSVMLTDARRRLKALPCPVGKEEARRISPHFGPETI